MIVQELKSILINGFAKFQATILNLTGFAIIRENSCFERNASLSQKKYFETFDFIRIYQLYFLSKQIKDFEIEGDVAELGVYRGYFAQKINEFFPERALYLFDTFEGFNEKDIKTEVNKQIKSSNDNFSMTSEKEVLSLFQDKSKVNCIKGYFPDSLDDDLLKSDKKYALVSIDTDLYQPCLEGLKYFYPRLSAGGYIMIHDYNNNRWPGIKEAVHEYFKNNFNGIQLPDKNGTLLILK
jgi:O-methyltransferase